MKTIIAGSRSITDFRILDKAIKDSGFDISEVVSGGARGVDTLGEEYAIDEELPLKIFVPDWKKNGRAAGPIRNRQMAEYADALIAIWDGFSRGTKNMIDEMRSLKKPLFILEVKSK